MEQSKYNVSVIIAVYNPMWEKYERTIMSVLKQKNVQLEIIICDDGSKDDCFTKVCEMMQLHSFASYTFVKNKENVGTVKNLFRGIETAKGEYVYCISPGDYFYDEDTLSRLYSFSVEKNAPVVFGDAIYYHENNHKVFLSKRKYDLPFHVNIFDERKQNMKTFVSFMLCGNFILGATFFRRRDIALKYMRKIIDVCKYVEDSSTTAYALADGVHHYHFNQYVVWYEDDSGISNSKSDKWKELLDRDLMAFYDLLRIDFIEQKKVYNIVHTKFLNKKLDKLLYLAKIDFGVILQWICISIRKKWCPRQIHQHQINDKMIHCLYNGKGVEECK